MVPFKTDRGKYKKKRKKKKTHTIFFSANGSTPFPEGPSDPRPVPEPFACTATRRPRWCHSAQSAGRQRASPCERLGGIAGILTVNTPELNIASCKGRVSNFILVLNKRSMVQLVAKCMSFKEPWRSHNENSGQKWSKPRTMLQELRSQPSLTRVLIVAHLNVCKLSGVRISLPGDRTCMHESLAEWALCPELGIHDWKLHSGSMSLGSLSLKRVDPSRPLPHLLTLRQPKLEGGVRALWRCGKWENPMI